MGSARNEYMPASRPPCSKDRNGGAEMRFSCPLDDYTAFADSYWASNMYILIFTVVAQLENDYCYQVVTD